MSKYFYNFKSGHFEIIKPINEDLLTPQEALDGKTTNTTNTKTSDTSAKTDTSTATTIDKQTVFADPEYRKIYTSILQNEIYYQCTNIPNARKKVLSQEINLLTSSTTESIFTNATVLASQNDLDSLITEYNNKKVNLDKQLNSRAEAISKTNESIIIPQKYQSLNESNLKNAKVYLNNFIINDDEHILKNMNDFKRLMKNSNLLYGKDKGGYFVICVDQDDFDELQDILDYAGFLKEDIIDCIMPQVLDRQNFVK